MKTLISFFSSNLSEIIAILWLLNIVFFIYAIFDTSKSGNNDLRKLCKMLDSSQWPLET